MTIIKEYSAREAAKYCGFNGVAMLDYLQRSGVFVARRYAGKRKGRNRRYEFRDLLVLKAIDRLLKSGASVASLKKALVEFQKFRWTADPVTLEDNGGIVRYLIANGDRVILVKDADVLVDLSNKGQLVFSFIIDLEMMRRELCVDMGLPAPQTELAFGQ